MHTFVLVHPSVLALPDGSSVKKTKRKTSSILSMIIHVHVCRFIRWMYS